MGNIVITIEAILMPSLKGMIPASNRWEEMLVFPAAWMMPRRTYCKGCLKASLMNSIPYHHSFQRSTP